MQIINFIAESIVSLGGLAGLYYLIDKLIQKKIKQDEMIFQSDLNGKLENLKSQLKISNDERIGELNSELEKLKAELAFSNNRLQVAYSGILSEHVDTLKKLYFLILELEDQLHLRSAKKMMTKRPSDIVNEFKNLYHLNGIFLPKTLDKQINELIHHSLVISIVDYDLQAERVAQNGDLEEANKLSNKASESIKILQKLRDDFRDEIRKLIAIDS